MDIYEDLEAQYKAITAFLDEPVPVCESGKMEAWHVYYDTRRRLAHSLGSAVYSVKQARERYDAMIKKAQGAAADPRGSLIHEICMDLQRLNDPHHRLGGCERYSVRGRTAEALDAAHAALGSSGFVFVHILIDWLAAIASEGLRARELVAEPERSNLERDDARRGWAIAKAGSAEPERARAAASQLFGPEEAHRLFGMVEPDPEPAPREG